jgi:hypothetical protein
LSAARSVNVACVTVTTVKDTLPAFLEIPDFDTMHTERGHHRHRPGKEDARMDHQAT